MRKKMVPQIYILKEKEIMFEEMMERMNDVFDTEVDVYLNTESSEEAEVAFKRMLMIAKANKELGLEDMKGDNECNNIKRRFEADIEKAQIEANKDKERLAFDREKLEFEKEKLAFDKEQELKKSKIDKISNYAGLGIKLALGAASLLIEYKVGKMMFDKEKESYIDTPLTFKHFDGLGDKTIKNI